MCSPEIQRAIRKGLRPLAVEAPLRLSQWAAAHFYLSAESSYQEKRWTAYPYQPAIMDCIGHDEIEEVIWQKPARVGYTKIILAAHGYFAHHKKRNQCIWQPTDEDADDYVKTEVDTMLRDVDAMREVFAGAAKDKSNTLRQKKFLGSLLHIRGGKAAKNYRRLSVDVGFIDEADGFDTDIEKEGSPVKLAAKRLEGATFPKLVVGSTPKIKGFSLVESQEQQCEARFQFYIPCPHCGVEHTLRWGGKDVPFGFKWTNSDPSAVRHLCEACGSLYSQAEYLSVWERGRWKTDDGVWIDPECVFRDADGNQVPVPRSVGFRLWTGYSPQASWAQIVRDFLSATAKAQAGDKSELKTFINTTLGETYEEEVEKTDDKWLKQRAESYPLRRVPRGGLVLVAGADVQGDRFEVTTWAFGRGEEMWCVDYAVIYANPADQREWAKLDDYLQGEFQHESGARLKIEAAAVDTGGHYTHQAYVFCRERKGRHIYAIKGDTKEASPVKGRSSLVDVNHQGKTIKKGVRLWLVGTDTAKDLLAGRLSVETPGPGYVHFSRELPDEFYLQLTAEARTTRNGRSVWLKLRQRNEVLDCTVYALFAAHARELHRFTDKMWERLEQAVQPVTPDMFTLPVANVEPPAEPLREVMQARRAARTAPRRRTGFVHQYTG